MTPETPREKLKRLYPWLTESELDHRLEMQASHQRLIAAVNSAHPNDTTAREAAERD